LAKAVAQQNPSAKASKQILSLCNMVLIIGGETRKPLQEMNKTFCSNFVSFIAILE
jgi:hypothetical protein